MQANTQKWLRIVVSVMTFGMVFPNAIVDGMKHNPSTSIIEDEKKS